MGFIHDIDQITCISCGPDRIAFASNKHSKVIYSSISSPSTHTINIELPNKSNLLRLEWLSAEPFSLLVIFELSLVIIDTQTNIIIHQIHIENLSDTIRDAHWTPQGNILCLTHNNVLVLYDQNLENSIVQNEINDEQSYCLAIDNNQIFIGHKRKVKVYEMNPETFQIIKRTEFIAHPHNIDQILVTKDHLVTLTDNDAVAWDKSDFVPLFPIKTKGSTLFVDPDGFLGITSEGTVLKLMNGKKSKIMNQLPLKDLNIESIATAAWYNDQSCKYLVIAEAKEPCVPYVIKFTHT